jgi:hypothetical protein
MARKKNCSSKKRTEFKKDNLGRIAIHAEGGTLLYKQIGLIKAYSLVPKVTSLIVTRN